MSEFDRQLAQILEAREERWGKRQFYAARFPALLSMTACIPMPLRADQAVELWFTRAASRTLEFLTERGQILELLEQERGIPKEAMLEKVLKAIASAYKKDHRDVEEENIVVEADEEHRQLRMFVRKTVVDEEDYVDPFNEMPLEEAKIISARYEIGDMVNVPVDKMEFGRIAAGNGKQVIIQKLIMQVDLKKIKDLQMLLSLLKEVEDYSEGNGDNDPDAIPSPA